MWGIYFFWPLWLYGKSCVAALGCLNNVSLFSSQAKHSTSVWKETRVRKSFHVIAQLFTKTGHSFNGAFQYSCIFTLAFISNSDTPPSLTSCTALDFLVVSLKKSQMILNLSFSTYYKCTFGYVRPGWHLQKL